MSEKAENKRKKILGKIVLIIIAVFVVLGVVYMGVAMIDAANKKREQDRLAELRNSKRESYVFFEPDYDYDIFDDAEYVKMNRGIAYKDGAVTLTITDGNYSKLPEQVGFIDEFLQNAIYGRVEELNAQYSDAYREKYEVRESFTMQKIHSIELELLNSYEMSAKSGNLRYDEYKLGYMIKNNTGTFRNDLPEGYVVPQWVKVVTYPDGTMLIDDIQTYAEYITEGAQ